MNMRNITEVCSVKMGQSPDSKTYNHSRQGIPFYQGNADFGEIHPRTRIWCTAPVKIANKGDILLSVRAPIGAMNISTEKCCIGRGLAAITPNKEKCDGKFLYYAILSKIPLLVSQGTGSTFKAIGRKVLEKIMIPNCTIERQSQIAKLMSLLEQLINVRNKQLINLEKLAKSRFIEMFGDPINNSKKLPTNKLKNILVLKAGDFTSAADIVEKPTMVNIYPCYGGNGIRGYVSEYNQEGEYSLIGRQGALSGNVQYAKGKFKNTEHALLVTPLIKINSIWLNQLLLNLDLKRYQTGAAQPGLSVKNLQEIQIIDVSIEEQNQFATFVEQVDKSKFDCNKYNNYIERSLNYDKL